MRKDQGGGSDSQCWGPRKGSMKQRNCLFFFKPMRLENTLGLNKYFAKNQMYHGKQTRSQASFSSWPARSLFPNRGEFFSKMSSSFSKIEEKAVAWELCRRRLCVARWLLGRLGAIPSQRPAHRAWLGLSWSFVSAMGSDSGILHWRNSQWLSPRQTHLGTSGEKMPRDISCGGCFLFCT